MPCYLKVTTIFHVDSKELPQHRVYVVQKAGPYTLAWPLAANPTTSTAMWATVLPLLDNHESFSRPTNPR